jgi:hypothetical protein
MLLWASRLNFHGIRNILIQYARLEFQDWNIHTLPEQDKFLPDIEASPLGFQTQFPDYMSSISQGWIDSQGRGWNAPEKYWRLCAHGKNWSTALNTTVSHLLSSARLAPCHYDQSIKLALEAGHTEFLRSFLRIYVKEHSCPASEDLPESARQPCHEHRDPADSYMGFDYPVNDSM